MKSHTLKGDDLDKLFRRAAQQGKEALYIINFRNYKLRATITLEREDLD
jgi:hypothetical protein